LAKAFWRNSCEIIATVGEQFMCGSLTIRGDQGLFQKNRGGVCNG
jgi:hypothetical protein